MRSIIHDLSLRLQELLVQNNQILTTAESCTGGWIAKSITDQPGSSAIFDRGFVTYSNSSKQGMLGVTTDTIAQFGAVSEQAVIEMAEGAIKHSSATLSISVSGTAGPTGGSKEKPVGTVWFGLSKKGSKTETYHTVFEGGRSSVREHAVTTALQLLIDKLT